MRTSRSTFLIIGADGTLRRILKRNLSAFIGLAGLAAAAAIAASLATWTVTDPSLSHATDGAIRNVLGLPGTVVSDLFTQMFGLSASLVLLAPVIWAWRLVFGRDSGFSRLRTVTWLAGVTAAALALASLPVMSSWPLPTGLGGVSGDLLLRIPVLVFGGAVSGSTVAVMSVLSGALAIALSLHACGLLPRRAPAPAPDEQPVDDFAEAPFADDESYQAPEDGQAWVEEDERDDSPSRMELLAGILTHMSYRIVTGFRRRVIRRRPQPRDFFDESVSPDSGKIEPRLTPEFDADGDFDPGDDVEAQDEPAPKPRRKRSRVAKASPKPRAGKRQTREAQASLLEADGFELPPLHLLEKQKSAGRGADLSSGALEQNAHLLEGVLDDFGVRGDIINVRPGPVVTLYELKPAPGIKSARVIGLADDIARSMSAISCRVAVIPGKNAIGIELPNSLRETVYLRELLASQDFEQSKSKLGLCLGKTIGGESVIADLSRMPHLLVAGTTGSGKSVSINTMILSLLYRMSPDECRLIMIDPKMLELSNYDGIPHLLTPVVTDPQQAVVALKWTVRQMEDRYRKMSKLGVRNLHGFNSRVAEAEAKGETLTRTVQTGFDPDTGEAIYEREQLCLEIMPFIVVIIDEMADLMMVAGKDIEGAVQRLAQMARAAGIHVIMATQRPSVDVITGTIKANFPTRISFQVTSKIDSRTILGEQGAEQLLGQGDMLYMAGGGRIQRIHGPFVSDEEVEDVVAFLKSQGAPEYLHSITVDNEADSGESGNLEDGDSTTNSLYDQAVSIVLRDRKASTSYVQRRLSIGYNRAASIIERMEEEGVVGPANHAGKRQILVGDDQATERFG